MNFDYFYKTKLEIEDDWGNDNQWDIFLSCYNSSERVKVVFDKVKASKKYWIIAPEYQYKKEEYPDNGNVFDSEYVDESEFINDLFDEIGEVKGLSICIDITGFMRHHLLYLIGYLNFLKINKFDVIYSEPGQYKNKDQTKFSNAPVKEIKPIAGYGGNHNVENSQNDLLILGVGYDYELVKQVVEHKDYAQIATLWGFPSLRADMYQENILCANKAGVAVFSGDWNKNKYFAKANDPFSTAKELGEIIKIHEKKESITNLYLSPLSTKPQVLGFSLFYICEWIGREASIIFPFSESYSRETSTGISKIWKYTIEF